MTKAEQKDYKKAYAELVKTSFKMIRELSEKLYLYETLFGEVDFKHRGLDILKEYKKFTEENGKRKEFEDYINKKLEELKNE